MKKMISIITSAICLVSCFNIPVYAVYRHVSQENDSLVAATYTRAGNVELCFADEDITALGDVTSHQITYYIPIDDDVAKKDEIVLRNLKNGVATFEEIDFDKFDYYKFFVEVRTKSEVRYGNWGSQTPFTFTGISEVNYGYSILPDTDMHGDLEYANILVKQSGFNAPRPYGNSV